MVTKHRFEQVQYIAYSELEIRGKKGSHRKNGLRLFDERGEATNSDYNK